jgi:hypothetical protein
MKTTRKLLLISSLLMTSTTFAEKAPPTNCDVCVLANNLKYRTILAIEDLLKKRNFNATIVKDSNFGELNKCLKEKKAGSSMNFSTRKRPRQSNISWISADSRFNYESSYYYTKSDEKILSLIKRFPDCEKYRAGELKFDGLFQFGVRK